MKTRLIALALLFAALVAVPVSAQQTYAVGNWTVTARQNKGIQWLYNAKNAELLNQAIAAGTFIQAAGSTYHVNDVITLTDSGVCSQATTVKVLAVNDTGGVTQVQVLTPGTCTSRQNAANHASTVSPVGGGGFVGRVNFYTDVPNLLTRNGGILDSAVTSYAQQREQQRNDAVRSALDGATDTQVTNALAALGVVDPQ